MAITFVLTIIYQIWLVNNFNELIKYAPLRLEGETLMRDAESEAPSTTANEEGARQVSGATVAAKQQPVEVEGKIDAPPRQAEKVPRPAFLTEKRPSSSRSVATAHLDRRTTDMEAQKKHDNHQAKGILARLNQPLNESRLAELESHLQQVEARVGNTLIPRKHEIVALMMNDPISKIIVSSPATVDFTRFISRSDYTMMLTFVNHRCNTTTS